MAVSVSEVARTVWGNKKVLVANVTFDSSYPTGGETLTAATLGFSAIEAVISGVATSSTPEAFAVRYVISSGKLFAFRTDQVDDIDEEAANTADLSAFSTTIVFVGN